MDVYIDEDNEVPLDEIFVAISCDEQGREGICSVFRDGMHMPMVFGHPRMVDKLRPTLKEMAQHTKKTIKIAKYKKSEILEVLK